MDYVVVGADGKEYGPVDLATLAEWAKADRVRPASTLKEFTTGRILTAGQVPGLFTPMAAPAPGVQADWSQPPDYYHRTLASQPAHVYRIDPNRYIVWAILDACLAILFVMMWRTVGPILFCGLSLYNSVRAVMLKHRLSWVALAATGIAISVVVVTVLARAARVL